MVIVTLLGGAVACSYGWEVGAPTGSGNAGAGGADAGAAGGGGGGPSCATRRAEIEAARDAAQSCTQPAQCAARVLDECGCRSWVADSGSAAAKAFTDAVQRFQAAGCVASSCACDPGCAVYPCGAVDTPNGFCAAACGRCATCPP